MIETQTLNDREAYVVYLDDQLNPVDKGKETLIKVIFKDTNETLWLVPPKDQDTDIDNTTFDTSHRGFINTGKTPG